MQRRIVLAAMAAALSACGTGIDGLDPTEDKGGKSSGYDVTITRTALGIPHISAHKDGDFGSLGYGYRITPGLRVNASYGTSFRAPTFNELYYPGYGLPTNRPEEGRNREIGVHFEQGGTALGAVTYRTKLTDLLVNTAPCPLPGFRFGGAYNVNKATLEGLSLSARQQLGNSFTLSASADLHNPQDDASGKLLVRRAKRHANVALDYTAGSLTAGAEWQVSSYRFDDTANRNRLGGYGLLNLYAAWEFDRSWTATLRGNNVSDKHYELARNYATAGSTVYAGLRYSYK